jgi:CHAT domain-containing protein
MMGRYPDAMEQFEASLKLSRDLNNRVGVAVALGGIGGVCAATGRYEEALRRHLESRAIYREADDPEGDSKATSNIGLVYERTGRYAEALRHYHESLKISRQLGNRAGINTALNNIGVVYQHMGAYREALQQFDESLKLGRELGDRAGVASTLNNIGATFRTLGLYEEALEQFEESLKMRRELKNPAHIAQTLNNLGVVSDLLGRPKDSLKYHEDGLTIQRELGDRAGAALTLSNIGWVYKKEGKHREALRQFQDAFDIADAIGATAISLKCDWGRGTVYRAQGDWRRAADAYRAATDHLEKLRANIREPGLQAFLLDENIYPYYGLADALLHLDQPADAFAVSERLRSRSLIDLLTAGRVDIRKGMTDDERKEEQQLQDRLTALGVQLGALQASKAGSDRLDPLRKEQQGVRDELEKVRHRLYLAHPALQVQRVGFSPTSLAELNSTLFARQPGLVVLSYLVEEEQTLLFVLTRGDKADGPARLNVIRLEVKAKELTEAVDEFRKVCREPGVSPTSEKLYRWLLSPIDEILDGAKHVVLIPDRMLNVLPFQALRPDEDGKYLIERCAVSYAPSLTALLQMQKRGGALRRQHGKEGDLLAVGIRDFGNREKALPQAEDEARAVARLFGDAGHTLLGPDATQSRLRAGWSKARYLHFATHGLLNEDAPFYSALVLSRGERTDEAQLFARDLLDADLHAELAVLSACKTGLGQRLGGEGVLGLSWAWFVAGVPSLVVSQWSVSDQATERLMAAFWSEVKSGTPREEALRRAQLRLLKDRGTRHPFYWAPFVLVGDFGG